MGTYADLMASAAYDSKLAGAAVAITIVETSSAGEKMIGAATGINVRDDFEQVPIEEAGEEGVNEIVTGRNSGSFTVNGFFSPKRNDQMLSRGNFLGDDGTGREFTIFETIAPGRQGEGTLISVLVGAKFNNQSSAHGARGVKTIDLSGVYLRRYTGEEYMAEFGS